MPGTFLGYPFDEEIFLMNWQAAQDPTRTAMIDSGAVQRNGEIKIWMGTAGKKADWTDAAFVPI